jgi:photosystem II stability/assembly factor-like uncharacterized protein
MNVNTLPQIVLPTPLLSLAANPQGGIWAGGLGGVAALENGGWQPRIAGLPVTGVAALAVAGGWLWAGGIEGIARSADGGHSWQPGVVHGVSASVSNLVVSPAFEQDSALLAATLAGGVLRSEDAGQSWAAANFGLGDYEATALLWPQAGLALAGTANGIYRSPNGGRAWRQAAGSEGQPVAALAHLADGRLLAALEGGGLLVSADGSEWAALATDLPSRIQPAALCVLADGALLLGALDAGIFRSDDGGAGWAQIYDAGVFSLIEAAGVIYAGTGTDLLASDDGGHSFTTLPRPPLHDLRQLMAVGAHLLVYGRYSGALAYEADSWYALTALAPPLGLLRAMPDGTLYASSMDGLFRCQVGGDWETLITGPGGYFSQLALCADGSGWACSHDYRHLMRTQDGGINWQVSESPFGVLPLVALEAAPGVVFGATFDPRQNIARMWRSRDGGVRWQPGAEVRTPWPLVATCTQPPLVALGSLIVVQQGDDADNWQRGSVQGMADFLVRQVVSSGDHLLALTTRGLLHSTDGGLEWSPLAGADLPADVMMSLALIGDTAYVLLVGGQVVYFGL